MSLVLLHLLSACASKQIVVDDADTATDADDDDSGVEQIGDDSDDETGGETGGETGDDGEVGLEGTFTFVLSGATDADRLELVWVDEDYGGVSDAVGGALVQTGSVTVDLAGPLVSDLYDVPDVPGLAYRHALPYVYVDEDGSAAHSDGEYVRGAGLTWALYLHGNVPAQWIAAGFVEGWNAFDLTAQALGDPDAVPLTILGEPNLDAALGGTVSYDLDEDDRLAVLPIVAFEGGFRGDYLYDEVLADPWEVVVDGAPDDDHLADLAEGAGLYGSIEVPVAYADDGDGELEEAELVGPACVGDDVGALLWIDAPLAPYVAYYLLAAGLDTGWHVVSFVGEDMELVDEESGLALEIGGTCSF